jgi:hypothetical protein
MQDHRFNVPSRRPTYNLIDVTISDGITNSICDLLGLRIIHFDKTFLTLLWEKWKASDSLFSYYGLGTINDQLEFFFDPILANYSVINSPIISRIERPRKASHSVTELHGSVEPSFQ